MPDREMEHGKVEKRRRKEYEKKKYDNCGIVMCVMGDTGICKE